MGIFDLFKKNRNPKDSKIDQKKQHFNIGIDFWESEQENIDDLIAPIKRPIEELLIPNTKFFKDAVCPYCSFKLDKSPLKKTKCQNCHNYIFVRTNMITKEKMLLTEEQVNKLEKERGEIGAKVGAIRSILMDNDIKVEFKKMKDEMKKENKKIPDMDILWGILNKKGTEYVRQNDWGFFRNTRYDMFEILNAEKRFQDALGMALEICYYDINGPNNLSGFGSMSTDFPSFDSKLGIVAPALVFSIKELKDRLNLQWDDVKNMFIERASLVRINIMPVPPKIAWNILYDELYKEVDKL